MLIVFLSAGGVMTMAATATRVTRTHNTQTSAEAVGYARQTLERFRNRIAADSPWITGGPPVGWQDDPLPNMPQLPPSILSAGAARKYRVTPQDCDGVGGPGDCFSVEVKVCWNQAAC